MLLLFPKRIVERLPVRERDIYSVLLACFLFGLMCVSFLNACQFRCVFFC